jgi:hypothetical protein
VAWGAVVTADARVVGVAGERQEPDRLAEVGHRVLAILRSLDQHASGFVRLRFEEGTLVGTSIGRHALVAAVTSPDDGDLLGAIDEVRAILADQDLAAVASHREPADEPLVDEPAAEPPAAPAPLVGARFGGSAPASRRARRARRR